MKRLKSFALTSACALTIAGLGFAACTATKLPDVGGLMVIVSTDGKLEVDTLEVTVSQNTKTSERTTRSYASKTFTLPNTIAVVSNGDPTTTAFVRVTARNKLGMVVDIRDTVVQEVPTERLAALSIVLSVSCTGQVTAAGESRCAEGETCDPRSGACKSAIVTAGSLGTYVAGELDAGVDARDGETSASDTAVSGIPTEWSFTSSGSARPTATALLIEGTALTLGGNSTAGTLSIGTLSKTVDVGGYLATFDVSTGIGRLVTGYADARCSSTCTVHAIAPGSVPGSVVIATKANLGTNQAPFFATLSGTTFSTAFPFTVVSGSATISSIVRDGANLYVLGTFDGTLTVGSISRTAVAGSSDVFIAKLDLTFAPVWFTSLGNEGTQEASKITLEIGDRSVWIAGTSYGALVVPGIGTLQGASATDTIAFFVNYGADGKPRLARRLLDAPGDRVTGVAALVTSTQMTLGANVGGNSAFVFGETIPASAKTINLKFGLDISAMTFGGDNEIFVAGSFRGVFGFGSELKAAETSSELYLGRISAAGVFDWTRSSKTLAGSATALATGGKSVVVAGPGIETGTLWIKRFEAPL